MFDTAKHRQAAVLAALGIALYWVLACWGIWWQGPFAMGINYTLFVLGIAVLFSVHAGERRLERRHWVWLVPIVLLAMSYALYENPFIKMVNILVLPPLFACYRIAVMTPGYERIEWEMAWIEHLIRRFFAAFARIGTAIEAIARTIVPFESRNAGTFQKVLLGLLIFLVLAIFIFIPLLSSADPVFGALLERLVQPLWDLLSVQGVARLLFFVGLSVALLAMALAWNMRAAFSGKEHRSMLDSVVSGVVLGGILVLYALFLLTQMRMLWVPDLPVTFRETEMLVKGGFWQLFVLTDINVFLFLVYYRRTHPAVQRILTLFTFASALLLFSAAQRMTLYVWLYGFSYEKFFAFYTVVFAVIVFGYLIYCLFRHERRDILKFLVYAFVWMYAVAAILPTEQFVFRANAWLSARPASRIDMRELQMLSADVYGLGRQQVQSDSSWNEWLEEQRSTSRAKQWFEWTLQDAKLRIIEPML